MSNENNQPRWEVGYYGLTRFQIVDMLHEGDITIKREIIDNLPEARKRADELNQQEQL